MAKGNDIGAYISLHVRKNQQQLGQEIQSAVDSVNRKIKINITKFAISNDALAGLNTRIQNHLKNKTFNLNVSVKKIDATEAINNVKMELARMVEAFRLDNGVNLKGIGNFTDGAYQKTADASAKAAATATAAVKEKAAADAQELEIAEATTQQEKAQVDLLNQINILKKEAATFAQNNPAFIGSDNSEHKDINQLLSDIEALKVSTTRMNAASKEELQEQQLAYSKLREQLSKYKAEQQEASNAVMNSNLVRRDKIMLGASSLGSTLSGLEGKALGLQGGEAAGFVEQIRTLQTEVTKLHKIASQTSGEEKATMTELENRLRSLTDQAKQLGIALGQTARTDPSKVSPNTVSAGKQYSTVTSLNNKIAAAENLLSNNTKLSGTQTGANIRNLVSSYESLRNQALLTTNMTSEGWAKLRNEIKANDEQMAQARIEMERYGLKGHSVLGKISEGIKRFGGWMLITHSLMSAIRAMKQAVSNVKEIDAAMTQLKIVTGATDQEMAQFSDTAFAMAQNLGKSVTEITKSIETFSRLGYNLQDSSELAKYATIMSNVADVSGEEATKGITSIIKGFNLDVADAEHVADILISVGQSYAVSASEMMEAYEKSGAALNATNTSLEKSAGLIAAANSSVQDASVIGTALKTVSARIRGSKTELEELGEDTSGLAQGFSKYADELKSLTGFDIMVDETHFKDLFDIFDGISKVWDKLNDTQKARVSEIFGGTRQLQVISSILGNWQDAVKAYGTAMNSAGTATQANATYMDSFQAKADQLKATFEEFSKDLFDSEFLKGGVDFLKDTLQVVGEIVKNVGTLPPLLAIIGGYLSAKNNIGFFTTVNNDLSHTITGVNQLSNQMGVLGRSFADIKGAWESDGFKGVKNLFADTNANFLTALDQKKLNAFAEGLANGADKAELLKKTMQGASPAAVDLAKATEASAEGAKNLETKVKSVATAEKAYTTTTIGARIATVAFQAAISFGIALAIQGLITLFEKLKDSIPNVENTTKWLDESSSKVKDSTNKLQELNGELNTVNKRIAELLNKPSLTLVEENELDRLKRTNAEIRTSIALEKDRLSIAQAKNAAEFTKNIKAQQEESVQEQMGMPTWLQIVSQVGAAIGGYSAQFDVANDLVTEALGDSGTKFERYLDKAKEAAEQRGKAWKDELAEENTFLSEYTGRLEESLNKLGSYDYNKLSKEAQGYVDYAYDSINQYRVLLGDSEVAFDSIYNQQRFDKSQKAIEQLKSEGKLTGEALKSLYDAHGNFYEMVNNLQEIGLMNGTTASSFDLLANQINGADNAIQEIANGQAAENLTKQLEELTTELSNTLSAFETVKSAITEYNEKGVLTAKTLSELINLNPQYLNLLVDENGQLNLNSQSYQELIKAKMRDMVITQMKSSLNKIMEMKAEEAQAYASAQAYDAQTGSIYDLIGAELRLSMIEAKKKDAANNTTAYSDAVLRTAQMYAPLIAAVDNYSFSAENAEKITDQKKRALEQEKDALEQNKRALEDNKKALEDQKDALEKSKQKLEDYKSKLTDAQSKIKDLIEAVSDYIKQQKEDEKDVLNERKDAFDELIDKEKEELDLKRESAKFDQELADKQNTVAKDTLAASIASLDDSAAGRKNQKQANDTLNESRSDLLSTLSDHEYDIRIAALDRLKEKNDEYYDAETQKIEDYLSNTRRIYEDACTMIENDTGDLYGRLWDYTYQHTTQTKTEFDYMWNSAHEALTRYGVAQYGVIGVMEYLQGEIYNTDAQINNLNLQIDNLNGRIEGISSRIDGVTSSINLLSDAINNQVNQALDGTKTKIANVSSEYTNLIDSLNQQLDDVDDKAEKVKKKVEEQPKVVKVNKRTGMVYYSDGTARKSLDRIDDYEYHSIVGRVVPYASGTNSASGGLSLVGEKGAELRILNKGDGVLTTSITKGLAALGSNPTQFIAEAGKRLISSLHNNSMKPVFGAVAGGGNIAPEINIMIQGDATQSTVNALKEQSNFIIKSAVRQVMSETLARRNISRVR